MSKTISDIDTMHAIFAGQRMAFEALPTCSYQTRIDRLSRLIAGIEENEDRLLAAINGDFGSRSRIESMFGEIVASVASARLAKKKLRKWMSVRRVETPLLMKPGRSMIWPQPRGVVGIISPWNYPVYLALSPLASALAAGNRAMIKPSELTPHTSALLQEIIADKFAADEVCAVPGGADAAAAFASLKFDHLLFTGSTAIGRKVAEAAAPNLTPLTLELGGKSPAIIDSSANLAKAARSIAFGKAFNAGQTCVAPDYVLTTHDQLEAVVEAIEGAVREMYPDISGTEDYSSIISERHYNRLAAIVEEAVQNGNRWIQIGEQQLMARVRKLPFTIIVNPGAQSSAMREEIFGPILPVVSVADRKEMISLVNSGDRPLALYWFGQDEAAQREVLDHTVSGGVTINDTNWHVVQENLPFGGVGQSGYGSYHGEAGFVTFSNMKPVFVQSRFANTRMLQPPYSRTTERILALAKKFM